jgi:hypothetical protein
MTSNNFHTTQWTLVRRAQAWPPEHRQQALSQLCQAYWMPLYVYLRRSGYSDVDAEDFVQGYFEQLLSNDYLQSVDSAKGRPALSKQRRSSRFGRILQYRHEQRAVEQRSVYRLTFTASLVIRLEKFALMFHCCNALRNS